MTYSQGPWKSVHLERLVSGFPFLSWGQATWKAPGLCRGEAVGMQPRWAFLGWATTPQPLWLLAASRSQLLLAPEGCLSQTGDASPGR